MRFDHDLCMLFLYHKCDELTLFHLESLRKHNPDACIIPLTDTVQELIPGSIDVSGFDSSFQDAEKWRSIDTTVYRWFENRTFNARKYLFIEYDCYCTVNLAEYYGDLNDADVMGVYFFSMRENPRWQWFRELQTLPEEDRKLASGIAPFTCTMFRHEALEKVVANVYRHDVFCELRLGTTIRKLNLKFRRLPLFKRSTICWHVYPWQALRPGLFHSIKSLDHNAERYPQPGAVDICLYDVFRSLTPAKKFLPLYLQREGRSFFEDCKEFSRLALSGRLPGISRHSHEN